MLISFIWFQLAKQRIDDIKDKMREIGDARVEIDLINATHENQIKELIDSKLEEDKKLIDKQEHLNNSRERLRMRKLTVQNDIS